RVYFFPWESQLHQGTSNPLSFLCFVNQNRIGASADQPIPDPLKQKRKKIDKEIPFSSKGGPTQMMNHRHKNRGLVLPLVEHAGNDIEKIIGRGINDAVVLKTRQKKNGMERRNEIGEYTIPISAFSRSKKGRPDGDDVRVQLLLLKKLRATGRCHNINV